MICAYSEPGKLSDFDVIKLYVDAIQQDDGLSRIKKFLIKTKRITAFLLLFLSPNVFTLILKKNLQGKEPTYFR